jgi:hypothetical protein
MDKLGRLADDLAAAAAAGDWQAVAAADAAIAAALAAPHDANGLAALRAAHAIALRQCGAATDAAAAQLATMQAGRDGWIAYALDSNSNLDGTPA